MTLGEFLSDHTSARRISALGALSIRKDMCVFHKDHVVLRTNPSFHPKVSTRFHNSQDTCLPSFTPNPTHPKERAWHNLDVRRAQKCYILRTPSIRLTDSLLVNISPPRTGRKVSTSTIGSTIRSCLAEAYKSLNLKIPEGITAHSLHSAANSTASCNRASVEEIRKATTWSSLSTFIRHYEINLYDSADAAFGHRFLQSVLTTDDDLPPVN